MLSYEDRISAIVKQIQSLKDANKQLERERDLLENQVTELKTQQLAFKKERKAFEEEQREEQKTKSRRGGDVYVKCGIETRD